MGFGGGSLGGNVLGSAADYRAWGGVGGGRIGLGLLPSSCKTVAAFNTCDNQQYAAAQQDCYAIANEDYAKFGFANFDDCVQRSYTSKLEYACAKYCPSGGGGGTYPWMVQSSATQAKQQAINVYLTERGYCPIGTDGKLGAGTCGAWRMIWNEPGVAFVVEDPPPPTCQSFTVPSQCKCPSGQVMVEGKCVVSQNVAPSCTKDEIFQNGKCVKKVPPPPPPPRCGSAGQACPCCAGYDCVAGKCQVHQAPAPPPKKMGMLWLGLAGALALGVGAYVMSQKKPHGRHPNRRRAPRVGRGRIYRYA